MTVAHSDGFATLSAGLLARKGAARPAMRPGGGGLDDLGWDDVAGGGPAAPKRAAITFDPPPPEVVRQQVAIADAFAAGPAPSGRRRAFTLRLDPDRHARLRAACAADGASAQSLLTVALDRLLAARTDPQEGQPT